MDRASYQRARRVFEQLSAAPPGDRAGLLDELCQGDTALRSFVEAMLRADEDEEGVVDLPLDAGVGRVLAEDLDEEEPLPEHIGPYEVTGLLGRGGMGVVYEAEERHPHRLVAIKVLGKRLHTPAQSEQFHLEAQAMARLQHSHIPRVLAASKREGAAYLVMERVDGVPLGRWVQERSPSLARRLDVLLALGSAVEHAHARGVLHRDLKPGNVLVTDEDHAFVMDFGIASLVEEGPLRTRRGTPAYMSPEQLRGEPVDERADVYSLGVLAWELLSDRLPWVDQTTPEGALAQRASPIPALDLGSSWLHRDLEAVLRRALAPAADERYPSARDLCSDLRAAVEHRPVAARPWTLSYRLGSALVRHGREVRVAGLVLGAVALAGGLTWAGLALAEHRAHLQAERAAQDHLDAAETRIDALMAQGRVDQADAIFFAFADDPTHRGTPALSLAWQRRAAHLHAQERLEEELDAWSRAYESAVDPDQERESLRGLGHAFRARWDWSGLGAVLELWTEETDDPLVAEGDILARDLSAHPHLSRFSRGRRLDLPRGWFVGAPTGELVYWNPDTEELWLLGPDLQVSRELHLPEVEGRYRNLATLRPGLFLAKTWADGGPLDLHLLELDGEGELEITWSAPGSYSHSAALADLDGDGAEEIYLSLDPLSRSLARLERTPEGWRTSHPHPQTDALGSDVNRILAREDGLLVAQGAWSAYELRAYGPGPDESLELLDALRLGQIRAIEPFHGPRGEPLLALTTLERMLNPRLFGEPGLAAPVGLYLVRWGPHLEVERFLELDNPLGPEPDRPWHVSATGDLDGDGLEDLALLTRHEDEVLSLLVRQLPDGGLEPTLVGGMEAVGAPDVDGDGVAELLVILDGEPWTLGVGDTPLPPWSAMEAREVEPLPSEPRCEELARMGLVATAATCGEQRAQLQPRAELLRWAAHLRSELGQEAAVLDDWEALLALEPGDAEGRRERARLLTEDLAFEEAVRAWEIVGVHDPEAAQNLAWLRPQLQPLERMEFSFSEPLHEAWQLPGPLGARLLPGRGVMRLSTFSDGAPVASLPLEAGGERVEVEAELEITHAEEASGVVLEVQDPEGEVLVSAHLTFGAGGGVSRRGISCRVDELGTRVEEPVDLRSYQESLRLSLVLLPSTGEVRCSAWRGEELLVEDRVQGPPWAGEQALRLSLRGSRPRHYGPWMHLVAELDHLTLAGACPALQAPPDGLHALSRGDARAALSLLGTDRPLARAVALHELERTTEAAALLGSAPDSVALDQLVRVADPSLSRRLYASLGERYLRVFVRAWEIPVSHWENGAAAAFLLAGPFDDLPATTPTQRLVGAWRARALWEDGQETRARALLGRVRAATPPDEDRTWCAVEVLDQLLEPGE